MRRRAVQSPAAIPDWLLSPDGTFLVDTPSVLRWCDENGRRRLAVFAEAVRRHDIARGIRSDRGIFALLDDAS